MTDHDLDNTGIMDDYINYVDMDLKDHLVTGQVEVDASATGVIDFERDSDWFRVELKGGHTYTIGMEGADTDMGTLSDPYIRGIRDASGDLVSRTMNDDGGEGANSLVTFTPEYSGTFYINAASFGAPWSNMPYAVGSYTLSVVDTTPEAREVVAHVSPSSGSSSSSGGGYTGSTTDRSSTGRTTDRSSELTDEHITGSDPAGNGWVEGTDGNDRLRAIHNSEYGPNFLDGGAGNDKLYGGPSGSYTGMIGGTGMDTFVIGPDQGTIAIWDFHAGVDKIDVSRLGLDSLADIMDHAEHPRAVLWVLEYGGTTIEVDNYYDVTADDFIF